MPSRPMMRPTSPRCRDTVHNRLVQWGVVSGSKESTDSGFVAPVIVVESQATSTRSRLTIGFIFDAIHV